MFPNLKSLPREYVPEYGDLILDEAQHLLETLAVRTDIRFCNMVITHEEGMIDIQITDSHWNPVVALIHYRELKLVGCHVMNRRMPIDSPKVRELWLIASQELDLAEPTEEAEL